MSQQTSRINKTTLNNFKQLQTTVNITWQEIKLQKIKMNKKDNNFIWMIRQVIKPNAVLNCFTEKFNQEIKAHNNNLSFQKTTFYNREYYCSRQQPK